ncbi:MAG: hypothetical protein HY308_01120 [Gammaproteobacteria bacterium]|nr:hypothetical protein [Gammaproteobacteria bacterium]
MSDLHFKPGEKKYALVINNDKKVCRYMLDVLNGKKNDVDAVEWMHYGRPEDSTFNYGAEYATFDINNDGRNETVVRWHGSITSVDVDSLFIFSGDVSLRSLQQFSELEEHSIGTVRIQHSYELQLLPPLPHEGWMQANKQYFPALTSYTSIHPFSLKGEYYVLLSESSDVKLDPQLIVVAQYKKGRVSSADQSQMRDICYLSRPAIRASMKRY